MHTLKDNVKVVDRVDLSTGSSFTGSGSEIIGDVEVLYRSKHGSTMFTRKIHRHNDLLVTGAVFLSEKANNKRSTFITVPLDQDLGVHTADQIKVDATTLGSEQICGFMVGNGGAGDTYNTVNRVVRTARSVPGIIPFRVVPTSNDLSDTDRAKYLLRVVKNDYAYYYGKTFDIEREINVQFEDGTVVPTDVDTTVVTKFVRTFTKYQAVITGADIREYFKITQGSTLRSLINSIGLITGYPGTSIDGAPEYFNVRGLTAMNMENQELKDSESTITVTYRLFIN